MDIGGNGGSSFKFETVGDTVVGKILSIEEVQQTDPKTGAPQFWDDYKTQPKMQYRVTLQTDLHDAGPDDDGHRAVYLKGSRKPETRSSLAAVLQACRDATGTTNLDQGGFLRLTYVGDGQKTNAALSAPKQYEAKYQAPQVNLGQPASQPSAPAPAPQQFPPAQQGFPAQPGVFLDPQHQYAAPQAASQQQQYPPAQPAAVPQAQPPF